MLKSTVVFSSGRGSDLLTSSLGSLGVFSAPNHCFAAQCYPAQARSVCGKSVSQEASCWDKNFNWKASRPRRWQTGVSETISLSPSSDSFYTQEGRDPGPIAKKDHSGGWLTVALNGRLLGGGAQCGPDPRGKQAARAHVCPAAIRRGL